MGIPTLMIALVLPVAFAITFGLTWWIRGRGFGELLELFGRGRTPPGPGTGGGGDRP